MVKTMLSTSMLYEFVALTSWFCASVGYKNISLFRKICTVLILCCGFIFIFVSCVLTLVSAFGIPFMLKSDIKMWLVLNFDSDDG